MKNQPSNDPRRKSRYRGAGDVVQAFAMPIAKAIDAMIGTDIKNCAGCEQRRKALNEILPFDDPQKRSHF